MKKLNIHFIPDLLRWKISIRWSTVVIHLLAVPCTVVPIAASLNLSHSDATAVSALPAETSIPWNALLPCLLNLLMSSTATVFLLLMKIFVTFFLKTVLDCLFHSVTSVVSRMFFKMNKSKNYTPGFIMVLHTFGRDLKWNPHIHCLISEGGYSDDGFWRPVHHFNYTYLRNAFRTALLDEMGRRLGSSFKKIKSQCYTNHKEGFYVYAKPNKCDPETVIKYIGRYLGRPVIATSRIDSYDEDSETVTFHYNRHEDDKYIQETIPALDFIRRLIRHIPETHFKMIRYGGLYARHREIDKNLHLAISKAKRHTLRDFNKWRTAILSSFGYDPLKCPDCKHEMLFLELYFNHKRVSLEEMYEKIMSKARRRWSSA